MTRRKLVEQWIAARRAEGLRVAPCLSCGSWFAQRRTPGRRSWWCGRQRCALWAAFGNANGRAPPKWMELRWFEIHGNAARRSNPKIPALVLDVKFPADRQTNRLLAMQLRKESA